MKQSFTLILLFIIHNAFAQSIPAAKEKAFAKRSLTFIENKGQVTDQYGNARHDIQYKTGSDGMSVFIGNGQLHYQWSKAETKQKMPAKFSHHFLTHHQHNTPLSPGEGRGEVYSMYRLDMTLEGANPHAQAIPADKQAYYENYHTTALHSDNASASAYNKVTYKNIYPHIDWTLYIKDNKLEYDFIVNPGGNVNDIKIKYDGATDIAHTEGNIKVTTPFGDVREQKLYAYEQKSGKPINAKFTCQNNTLGFSLLTTYDYRPSLRGMKQTTIVIDPTLAWGTYFGGSSWDVAYANACDNAGNIFICGFTESVNNIATIGAYQTVYAGAQDADLAKFNSSGTLLWATYYGGESQDIANGVACDGAGNVYITGQTYSTHNIATPGSHQPAYGGQYDAFLAAFSSSGAILWATYYGGASNDIGYGVTCDVGGNIYLCGGTGSANNIATPGSYQDTLGGHANVFLAKFNNSGIIIWATYFGLSTGGSGAIGCICDNENNVYITGNVGDTGIYATPGSYQSSDGYGDHSFIAKFDSSCHLKWSTYYGGNYTEYGYGVACDDSLNVYITGVTTSTSGIASAGAYQPVYGGGDYDVFLAKFNDTGALQWSTYYGGSGDDQSADIACDGLGNIYIAGLTNSPNNITTPSGYQLTDAGGLDAFVAKFSGSGGILWGSYYGGGSEDVGTGVAVDGVGNIYLAGYTASANNIATLNSYPASVTDSFKAFLVKFDTGTTGISILTQNILNVQLYPSPNTGNFTVTGEFTNTVNKVSIDIVNEEGQIIYNYYATLQNGQLNKTINIQATTGIYFMKVVAGNETKKIKFLIE